MLEWAAQLFSPKEAGYSCSVPAIVAVTVPPLLTVTPAGKLVRHGQLARPCASARAARHAAASARSAIEACDVKNVRRLRARSGVLSVHALARNVAACSLLEGRCWALVAGPGAG